MATDADDKKNLSLAERIREAPAGAAIALHPPETMSGAMRSAERIRQERIDDRSQMLAQQLTGVLLEIIRNEMDRKP